MGKFSFGKGAEEGEIKSSIFGLVNFEFGYSNLKFNREVGI